MSRAGTASVDTKTPLRSRPPGGRHGSRSPSPLLLAVLCLVGAALMLAASITQLLLWSEGGLRDRTVGPLFVVLGVLGTLLALGVLRSPSLSTTLSGTLYLLASTITLVATTDADRFGAQAGLEGTWSQIGLLAGIIGTAVLAGAAMSLATVTPPPAARRMPARSPKRTGSPERSQADSPTGDADGELLRWPAQKEPNRKAKRLRAPGKQSPAAFGPRSRPEPPKAPDGEPLRWRSRQIAAVTAAPPEPPQTPPAGPEAAPEPVSEEPGGPLRWRSPRQTAGSTVEPQPEVTTAKTAEASPVHRPQRRPARQAAGPTLVPSEPPADPGVTAPAAGDPDPAPETAEAGAGPLPAQTLPIAGDPAEDAAQPAPPMPSHTLVPAVAEVAAKAPEPIRGLLLREQDVLSQLEQTVGPDHPSALTSRMNIAYYYLAAGEVPQATILQEQVVDDSIRILGAGHPHTLTAQAKLANWRKMARKHRAGVKVG